MSNTNESGKGTLDVECRGGGGGGGGGGGDEASTRLRICCHDSRRIIPWTLFSSFVTLTVVLLVLFLIFKDHHLEGNDPQPVQEVIVAGNLSSICGRRAPSPHRGIDTRVAGGRPTTIESWPWVASLRNGNGDHFCMATLISDHWLLTAAHCVSGVFYEPLDHIVMGDTSLDEPSEYHVTRENVTVYVHPDFNAGTFANDIALIRFDPKISATDGVLPACLNEGTNEIDTFTKCYVVGWGATSYSDVISTVLQEGRLPLVPRENCSRAYGNRRQLTPGMICAVSSDWQVDACKGDSGGPLMCEDGDKWSVVGVTSFGYGCFQQRDRAPGVYSRVSSYFTDFIKQTAEDAAVKEGGGGRR